MKIAIIGDVHNGYNRLERTLKTVNNEVDAKIQLGDLAGGKYAHFFRGNGLELSIELARKYDVIVVNGNHDSETLEKHNHLSKESRDFLEQLPNNYVFEELPEIVFSHKPPSGKSRRFTLNQFNEEIQIMEKELDKYKTTIYGHIHISSVVSQELENSKYIQRVLSPPIEKPYHLKDNYRYLICAGSISSSVFGFLESKRYLIFDSKKKEIIFKKIK